MVPKGCSAVRWSQCVEIEQGCWEMRTSGMAYTKLPSGGIAEEENSAVVLVQKRRMDVARMVKCVWMRLPGAFGKGMEN